MAGLGLLATAAAGALEGAGRSAAPLADYASRSAIQEQAAEAQRLRDERLQEFQRSERVAGQEFQVGMEKDVRQPFQRETQQLGFTHAEKMQKTGFEHTEAMQKAQQAWQGEQNEAQRALTREQIASHERIAAGNNSVALQVARIGGSVQQDKDGNFLFVDKEGNTKQVMDPNNPGQPLKGLKDLTPAAKAFVDTIKAQLVDLDRAEVAAMGDKATIDKIEARRAALTAQQLNVLTGGISASNTPKPAAPSAAPTAGTVVDGYKFKGGDPKDKSNWSPIAAPASQAPTKPSKPAGLIASGGPDSPASSDDNRASQLRAELATLGNDRQSLARKKSIEAELQSLGR